MDNIDVRFEFYQESSDMMSRLKIIWEEVLLLSPFEDRMQRMSAKAVLTLC